MKKLQVFKLWLTLPIFDKVTLALKWLYKTITKRNATW